jgi:4-carboxymuconolactone decarboxylase
VICTVGTFYQSEFEVAIHKEIALKCGVEAEPLEKLCKGIPSDFTGAAAMAHQITVEMLGNHRISEKTYQAALDFFTPEKMMELVATVGYYCLVSHTLNAFEIPLNDNMVSPFK